MIDPKDLAVPYIFMAGSLYFGFFTSNPSSPFWGLPSGTVLWLLSIMMWILLVTDDLARRRIKSCFNRKVKG